MFGKLLHPRPSTGDPIRDLRRIARRIYVADKAEEALERLSEEYEDDEIPRPRTIKAMPNPGQTAFLGELLSVDSAEVDDHGHLTGNVRVIQWPRGRGPAMLWSPRLDAVVSFPGEPIAPPMVELTEADRSAADVYRTWTRGRPPYGKGAMRQPAPPMRLYGPAIATLYASDKFHDRGRPPIRPYLHHHDKGVELWVSSESGAGRGRITAIMVRGGQLRVTEDGLAG